MNVGFIEIRGQIRAEPTCIITKSVGCRIFDSIFRAAEYAMQSNQVYSLVFILLDHGIDYVGGSKATELLSVHSRRA